MTLIRRARVFGAEHTDVRWHGTTIVECGTGLRRIPGEEEIDAAGGWLLPGLHDHHLHLRSLAATADSLTLGPPQVRTAADLTSRLRRAGADLRPGAWVRGIGYHESVAGQLDRHALDLVTGEHPVRIQHRSGALWMLNSRACAELGLDDDPHPGIERAADGHATGRLFRMDGWLGARLTAQAGEPGSARLDLAAVSARAAARGVTGLTDATPALDQAAVDDLARAVDDGRIVQRLHCMAPPDVEAPGGERFSLGPTKILLDDTTLPDLDRFVDRIRQTHTAGRPVAVHCVTRVQLILTMTALDIAGIRPGDRIEHGAIVPSETIDWLRTRRVPVVTQPHFLVERAEQYAREVPATDRPDLWRLGSLVRANVCVAAGTDAPFGSADPWRVIDAAVNRPASHGVPEHLSLELAVRLFTGHPDRPTAPRTITPGAVADLTLLAVPPEDVPSVLADPPIAATVVDGRVVH